MSSFIIYVSANTELIANSNALYNRLSAIDLYSMFSFTMHNRQVTTSAFCMFRLDKICVRLWDRSTKHWIPLGIVGSSQLYRRSRALRLFCLRIRPTGTAYKPSYFTNMFSIQDEYLGLQVFG